MIAINYSNKMLTEWFAAQNCDSVQIGVLFENIPGVSFVKI